MKYELQTQYQHLKPLIENIEYYFQQSSQVLHAERNEIRIVSFEGDDYVIKSFKIPNLINRFAYRYLRSSKAKRSYAYSLKLGRTLCPEPVAYLEQYETGLLSKSYFIARHFDYDFTIRPVLTETTFKNRIQILEAFAAFTLQLHETGVLHRDYSPGNILIKQHSDSVEFKIIDVNRMQFKTLDLQERLTNFARLMVDDSTMKIMLERYALLMNCPPAPMLMQAIQYRDAFARKRALKNKLRGR